MRAGGRSDEVGPEWAPRSLRQLRGVVVDADALQPLGARAAGPTGPAGTTAASLPNFAPAAGPSVASSGMAFCLLPGISGCGRADGAFLVARHCATSSGSGAGAGAQALQHSYSVALLSLPWLAPIQDWLAQQEQRGGRGGRGGNGGGGGGENGAGMAALVSSARWLVGALAW